ISKAGPSGIWAQARPGKIGGFPTVIVALTKQSRITRSPVHVVDEMRPRLDLGQPARRVDRCLLEQSVRFGWGQRAHRVERMAAVLKELSHEGALEFGKGIADGGFGMLTHRYSCRPPDRTADPVPRRPSARVDLVADNPAALHHEPDALQFGDIGQRVA